MDKFETLQALLSWSVNMYVILASSSISFLSLFLTFEHSYFWGLNTTKVHYCGQFLLQFYTDQVETLKAPLSWSVDVHVVLALS